MCQHPRYRSKEDSAPILCPIRSGDPEMSQISIMRPEKICICGISEVIEEHESYFIVGALDSEPQQNV